MLKKIEIAVLSVLAYLAFAAAEPRQSLRIVPDPSSAGVRAQGDVIRVEWLQLDEGGRPRNPDPGNVFYASAPAGGDLAKYTKLTSVLEAKDTVFSGDVRKRVTSFIPNRQGGRMGPGVYYIIVASSVDSTQYSDYFRLMVESAVPPKIKYPEAKPLNGEFVKVVAERAPVFMWERVQGVPYYHIILSDKPFVSSNNKLNTDVNIVWQAITQNTQITYGAPDPSNTVTSAPPPLALGKTYSWMVLNNYGNRPEFTAWSVVNMSDAVAGRFKIGGAAQDTLKTPRVVSPKGGTFRDGDKIEFKWDRLDARASSYLVNILREGTAETFGMEGMGDFKMGMLAWETVVPRGDQTNALSVTLDAAGTLTGGLYRWRVYALDSRGAAFTDTVDGVSDTTFRYDRSDEGFLSIKTLERIGGVDLPVGYVELKSEVVNGPTMAPLLFYTGSDGVQARAFSAGTYRITALKEGYVTYTTTVTVGAGTTAAAPKAVTISMSRPEAALYGRVLTADSLPVSAAKVVAVSSWGDTVSAATDQYGNVMFACRAADWVITAEKPNLRMASPPKRVSLKLGDNASFDAVYLAENPFALSGVVRNSSGQSVAGARVRVLREGVLVNELASTPQNGAYVFYLSPGKYTLTAEKPGFAMFSRNVTVAGTTTQDITVSDGAVLVSGVIIGKSWVAGLNDWRAAPITSARVAFADAARPDTFTVASDAVFGKFSVSLPKDRVYNVTASAAGFAAPGGVREFNTINGVGDDLSKPYAENGRTDTLYALATIKAGVTWVAESVPVDVVAYDAADGRVIASGRIVVSGNRDRDVCELSNIPDGNIRVVAGAEGYFTPESGIQAITVRNGGLAPNREVYSFTMEAGNRNIDFEVSGYTTGSGEVKVYSPLNRTLPFDRSASGNASAGRLENVGDGEYVVGVVPKDTTRLELSYHKFTVSGPQTKTLYLPFTHTASAVVETDTIDGRIKIDWPTKRPEGGARSEMRRVEIYYKSEGSAVFYRDTAVVGVGVSEFRLDPARVRDGCNLYYYFLVHTDSGDVYGSSSRVYSTYVRTNDKIISYVAVEPGVTDAGMRDTLVLPSSYRAAFNFKAYYSDQFGHIVDGEGRPANVGQVSWKVWRVVPGSENALDTQSTGTAFSYVTTPPDRGVQNLILQATLAPSNGYRTKSGAPQDTVRFPVKVTGKQLDSTRITILRKGEAGPILNNKTAGFSVEAFDAGGAPVTVSPREWRVYPVGAKDSAGTIDGDGVFTPSPKFVGMAGIVAVVGGRRLEYTEPGADVPGQRVNYMLRRSGSEANTLRGMRAVFSSVKAGASTILEVTIPQMKNYIYRGTENYIMVDTVAFDVTIRDTGAIGGDVVLEFDIPQQFRNAANGGDCEFRVARWFSDSLKWVPTDSTRIAGGVVSTVLSRAADGDAGLNKRKKASVWKASKASALSGSARYVSKASELSVSARYALVMRTSKTSLSLSISPHPFSPYIRPVKEYGENAPAGTCIKVGVQAADPFVRSVKVRVYNATGKLVWGIEKQAAHTGENHFWWNGRTSGHGAASAVSEVVWTDDYYNSSEYNSRPLCRNGRYYVMAILTDMDGKQKRVMKPLVLMK